MFRKYVVKKTKSLHNCQRVNWQNPPPSPSQRQRAKNPLLFKNNTLYIIVLYMSIVSPLDFCTPRKYFLL